MRVLIADDDRVYVRMVSNYLKEWGLDSIAVYDGVQTMMFAGRTKPDLILLDISMPAGNGFEVLKNLKASSGTGRIPVVVVTGSVELAAERKVLEGGAVAFMRKPPDMSKLYEVICRVLGIPGEPSPKQGLSTPEVS
ncbi:MAG TPA: response regulator [Terriglobia bacterium]|nr:response regulator [Terriglobia bacterium]